MNQKCCAACTRCSSVVNEHTTKPEASWASPTGVAHTRSSTSIHRLHDGAGTPLHGGVGSATAKLACSRGRGSRRTHTAGEKHATQPVKTHGPTPAAAAGATWCGRYKARAWLQALTRLANALQHLHHPAGAGPQLSVALPASLDDLSHRRRHARRQRRAEALGHLHHMPDSQVCAWFMKAPPLGLIPNSARGGACAGQEAGRVRWGSPLLRTPPWDHRCPRSS